jgi:hypothetical protein
MMCRNLSNLSNVTLTTNDDTRYPVAIAVKNKEASSKVQLATICRSNSVGPPCPMFHPCSKIKKLLLKYSWLQSVAAVMATIPWSIYYELMLTMHVLKGFTCGFADAGKFCRNL